MSKKKKKDFDSKANIIVKSLPKDLDQQALYQAFSEFGKIISCKLEVYSTGESRCFGYVQFELEENANAAIEALNGKEILGKVVEVVKHSKRDERGDHVEKYTNLFVQNLPADYTVEHFKALFSDFGEIDSIVLNEKNKGTGFISFKEHSSAKEAIEGVHMKKILNEQALIVSPHISRKDNDVSKHGGNQYIQPIVKN